MPFRDHLRKLVRRDRSNKSQTKADTTVNTHQCPPLSIMLIVVSCGLKTTDCPPAAEDTKPPNERSNPDPSCTDNTEGSVSSPDDGLEPRTLWNDAYSELRKKNPKLIDAYEKDLLASHKSDQEGMPVQFRSFAVKRRRTLTQQNCADSQISYADVYSKTTKASKKENAKAGADDQQLRLQKMVDEKVQVLRDSRLKFTLGGKEVIVKEQVGKIVRVIISAKDFIGAAISSDPHAALAWAGVLVVLPVSIYVVVVSFLAAKIFLIDTSEPHYAR